MNVNDVNVQRWVRCVTVSGTRSKEWEVLRNLTYCVAQPHAQRYFFPQVYSLKFFLNFAHLWWFGVWGFGVGVLFWVFGVGAFSWWGLGPVVWGLLGFLGLGSLYKHKRITLGKKMVHAQLTHWTVFLLVYFYYWLLWLVSIMISESISLSFGQTTHIFISLRRQFLVLDNQLYKIKQ